MHSLSVRPREKLSYEECGRQLPTVYAVATSFPFQVQQAHRPDNGNESMITPRRCHSVSSVLVALRWIADVESIWMKMI